MKIIYCVLYSSNNRILARLGIDLHIEVKFFDMIPLIIIYQNIKI